MAAKLTTEAGRAEYRRRKGIVEPVFGQIKEARGFRRFLLRGRLTVTGEWDLTCAVHNLDRLFRYVRATAGAPSGAVRPGARARARSEAVRSASLALARSRVGRLPALRPAIGPVQFRLVAITDAGS
jgi:hypothetical protein